MKTIATVIALSIGFVSGTAIAQSADEALQPRFKRPQIVSTQDTTPQSAAAKSPYSYLTETSPN